MPLLDATSLVDAGHASNELLAAPCRHEPHAGGELAAIPDEHSGTVVMIEQRAKLVQLRLNHRAVIRWFNQRCGVQAQMPAGLVVARRAAPRRSMQRARKKLGTPRKTLGSALILVFRLIDSSVMGAEGSRLPVSLVFTMVAPHERSGRRRLRRAAAVVPAGAASPGEPPGGGLAPPLSRGGTGGRSSSGGAGPCLEASPTRQRGRVPCASLAGVGTVHSAMAKWDRGLEKSPRFPHLATPGRD